MSLNCSVRQFIVLTASLFGVACACGQTFPVQEPNGAVQSTKESSSIVARMLSAHYERRPSIAYFDVSAEQDPPKRLQRNVALGKWSDVSSELASLRPDDAARVHLRIISSLAEDATQPGQDATISYGSLLTPADVLDLIDALPEVAAFSTQHQIQLGRLLGKSLAGAELPDEILDRLRTGTRRLGGDEPERCQQTAIVLAAAGQADTAWDYFGDEKPAIQSGDPVRAELYVRTLIDYADGAAGKTEITRERLIETIKLLGECAEKQPPGSAERRQYILLVIRIAAAANATQLLDAWLEGSLKSEPAFAREILLAAAQGGDSRDADGSKRTARLAVQQYIVEKWIASAGSANAGDPPAFFDALLESFCAEAAVSGAPPAPPRGPEGQPRSGGPQAPPARAPDVIPPEQLLSMAPSEEWRSRLSPAMAGRIRSLLVDLQLRLDRVNKAVELFAGAPPLSQNQARTLAKKILVTWTKLHNRASDKAMSGAQPRSIPLAVSDGAQARNLAELSKLAEQLRSQGPGVLPVESFINALVSSHGRAALLKRQDVECVFGPIEKTDAETTLQLTSALRQNLQQAVRTMKSRPGNGNPTEVSECRSGFELIGQLFQSGMVSSNDWRLALNLGVSQFEFAEFCRFSTQDTSKWLELRKSAFESLQLAAKQYAATLSGGELLAPEPAVYVQWFVCAMGNSDVTQITGDSIPEPAQFPLISQSIHSLPASISEQLMSQLAQALSTQAPKVKPEAAQSFASAALSVVGEIPAAEPLMRSVAYYRDILSEMKLVSSLDGDANIGLDKLFGVQISLQFTPQLDREVDGFVRLLQTARTPPTPTVGVPQPSGLRGRLNYRERFENYLRRAVGEKFEIVSILWSDAKTQPLGNSGWQQLPLLYVLLKAKDASVDLFPSAQMALDFGDRNAADWVLLPVISAPIPLNTREASERPFSVLEITQTLNDREAAQGKASLEIKANGTGLLPGIDQILNVSEMGDFEIGEITDQGLMPDRFAALAVGSGNQESPAGNALQSQRIWTIALKSKSGTGNAAEFRFPSVLPSLSVKGGVTERLLRYAETDIVPAEKEVVINAGAFQRSSTWIVGGVCAVVLGAAVALVWVLRKRRSALPSAAGVAAVPENLTLFSMIRYLRTMRRDFAEQLPPGKLAELDAAMQRLESVYSTTSADRPLPEAQLTDLAKIWFSIGAPQSKLAL